MAKQGVDVYSTLKGRLMKKALAEEAEESGSLPRMTPKRLLAACIEHDGYETPELNDKLYLHFKVRADAAPRTAGGRHSGAPAPRHAPPRDQQATPSTRFALHAPVRVLLFRRALGAWHTGRAMV